MAVKFKQRNQKAHHKRAAWSSAYVSSLPDSSFAAIDEAGRHLPYKDKDGKVDLPHLRNALARLNQTQISPDLKAKARKKLEAAARQAGVGDYDNDSEGERMTTPTMPVTPDDAALDPLALLQRAQDTFMEVADALGYDPLTLVERAKKSAPAGDEDEEDGDDESDEDESEDEDEDEEEEDVPPSKSKPGKGKFAPRFTKKREQTPEPVLTRGVTVKAFTTPNLDELAYIPFNFISRNDAEKREVEGVLSNEQPDTFGTIFDYDSMKRAVESRWHRNVREQHDPKKAVGKGVMVICDDDQRQVTVRARISKGAEDTWQKILDGTLCGFSIGAANAKTETRMIGDKAVPCYKDFDLAEISVVDAPSNPGAARSGLTLYRSAIAVQAADDVYADVLAADEVTVEAVTSSAATDASAEPTIAPSVSLSETEIEQRVAEAEAALMRGDAFGAPQVTTGTPEANDTGTPAVPTGAELDALDKAMHTDTGLTHAHTHAYNPSTVHMDQNAHHHSDGTQHAHHHMHGHVGHGDGKTPHVHGHEHDHNFQRAAADGKGPNGFIGEGDSRMEDYLSLVQRAQKPSAPPAALPTKVAETSGNAASIPVPLARPSDRPSAIPVPTTVSGGSMPAPLAERTQVPDETRYGQRISGDTRTGMHEGALLILRTCGCPTCQDAIQCYDPDNDGDDDVDEGGDTDHDAMVVMPRVQRAQLTRAVAGIVQQQMQPIIAQQRQIAARLAGVQTPDLSRMQTQLDEVRSVLTEVQGLVSVIAEQEQPGAPIVRATDKRLAIHPTRQQGGMTPFSDDQLSFLRKQNLLTQPTADQQTALAEQVFRQRHPGS